MCGCLYGGASLRITGWFVMTGIRGFFFLQYCLSQGEGKSKIKLKKTFDFYEYDIYSGRTPDSHGEKILLFYCGS